MSKVKNSDNLIIPSYQYTDIPNNLRNENYIIPSTSAPSWGGFFTFDYREKGCMIHNLTIQLNTSSTTGLTGTVTNYPNLNPAFFWLQRFELVIGGNIIDTRYAVEQFLHSNFFYPDETRLKTNTAAGLYSSLAARNGITITGSTVYIDLFTFFELAHFPMLTSASDLQIRVYVDTLANQINTSTLTGTPINTINSANLIAKITRLSSTENSKLMSQLMKGPQHYLFNEMRYGSTTIASGATNCNWVLSSIVGPVSYLFFTVRNTNALTGNSQFSFNQITSFSILDATSTNIVGGQNLGDSLSRNILNKDWTLSTYSTETGNGAYAYLYSFGSDPVVTATTGAKYGHHLFNGSEQLQIVFTSALASPVQIDIYASVHAVLEVTPSYIKKVIV
jgi:hypothetical protein